MTELSMPNEKKDPSGPGRRVVPISLVLLFLFGAFVQFLVWQNNKSDVDRALSGVTLGYQADAQALLSGELTIFAYGANPPGDASVLAHPPGYSILVAVVYGVFGRGDAMRIVQILLCSLAPVLVFLIVFRLFEFSPALIAGLLIALSPQLAYNSVLLLPDSISVIAVLTAVYFLVRWHKSGNLKNAVLCGLALGAACWLRANTLLLPVVFVFLALAIGRMKNGPGFALTMMGVFLLVIAPITIRNYIGFGRFVPISLGSGVTFVEGIADFDKDGRFGLEATDDGIMRQEARDLDRPDYYGSLYNPDGINRESYRIQRGLSVVKADPIWFAGAAARRGIGMFRFERVPVIADKVDEPNLGRGSLAYYLNFPLRLVQGLFITAVFLPLLLIGTVLLLTKKDRHARLAILFAVPFYFVCFQSLLHTEYRYVLAVHVFVLIIAAITLAEFFKTARAGLKRDSRAGSQ